MNRRTLIGWSGCWLAAMALLAQSADAVDAGRSAIVVFAASSLTDAMQQRTIEALTDVDDLFRVDLDVGRLALETG